MSGLHAVAARPPRHVVWDITYACPLRCVHCYSEAGRRPSRALGPRDMHRVCDALIELGPEVVVLSGGEPLVVAAISEVISHLHGGGIGVHVYTGGWALPLSARRTILDVAANVTVSVDGANAAVHDSIRGRPGSFARAMRTLTALDQDRDDQGGPALGIDYTVMRSNIGQLRDFCTEVLARFAHLDYAFFGAVMPIGLASRPGFEEHELLDRGQLDALRDPRLARELGALAPSVDVCVSDNGMFQMHPDRLAAGEVPAMQVEPDGRVRAMPVYEGTVGSLLEESPLVLWERAVARWSDPLVASLLREATTMAGWASATRQIDLRFGSPADRARIACRPAYTP